MNFGGSGGEQGSTKSLDTLPRNAVTWTFSSKWVVVGGRALGTQEYRGGKCPGAGRKQGRTWVTQGGRNWEK